MEHSPLGMHALVRVHQTASKRGESPVRHGVSGVVLRVVEITGLVDELNVGDKASPRPSTPHVQPTRTAPVLVVGTTRDFFPAGMGRRAL